MAKSSFKYLSIIVFEPSWAKHTSGSSGVPGTHPLEWGEQVLFLGDIPNGDGHCAVAKHSGKVVWLLHPQDFRLATEDET
jgi:hypothetical protein